HAAVARAVGADDEDVGVERGAPVLVLAGARQARGAPVPLEPSRPVAVLWVVQPMCPELAVAGAVGSDDADRVAVGGYVGDRVVQRLRIATGTFGPLRTVGTLRVVGPVRPAGSLRARHHGCEQQDGQPPPPLRHGPPPVEAAKVHEGRGGGRDVRPALVKSPQAGRPTASSFLPEPVSGLTGRPHSSACHLPTPLVPSISCGLAVGTRRSVCCRRCAWRGPTCARTT